MRRRSPAIATLALSISLAACGGERKAEPPAPSASVSAAPAPEAARGPLSIVLESRSPIVLSALEGGVVITDAARTRLSRSTARELADQPMPAGLPSGPGRVVRAAGRLPGALWLLFEKQTDDGKRASDPVFRLQRDGFQQLADDWRPAIAAWSKNRVLAASTSSGRLKIKVIEPSLPKPPDDLPSAHLADPSCEKSLKLADMIAWRSGDVLAAGTCKPDIAAGAGASAKRYVVLRWPATAAPTPSATPSASASAPASALASASASASPPIASAAAPASAVPAASAIAPAGAAEPAPLGPPGLVDVLPGVSSDLAHQVIAARSPADVYVAALESRPGSPPISRVFHFDGSTWGAEPLPAAAPVLRGLAAAPDGALWLVTEHALWKKPPGGAWAEVPAPIEGAWEMIDAVVAGDDVWIAARVRSAAGVRDVVLRTRPAKDVLRWE